MQGGKPAKAAVQPGAAPVAAWFELGPRTATFGLERGDQVALTSRAAVTSAEALAIAVSSRATKRHRLVECSGRSRQRFHDHTRAPSFGILDPGCYDSGSHATE